MASAFTHAFAGAALSALAPRPYRDAALALLLAGVAAAPDLDVVGFRYGIAYAHPLGHRGLTHSLFFALCTGVLLAAVIARARGAPLRSRATFGLAAVIALAAASHGVLDALTRGGLGVGFFVPFDNQRYFFPWRPLLVSPISAAEFFDGVGVEILRNEIAWVWVPLGLAVGLLVALRARASRRAGVR